MLFQDDKIKQSFKMKLEMAKFLQHTLDEMAVTGKGRSSKSAKEFVEFFEKVMNQILMFSTYTTYQDPTGGIDFIVV